MEHVVVTWSKAEMAAIAKHPASAVRRAMRKAGGDAIRAMRAESKRRLRDRKMFKASELTKGMKIRLPKKFNEDAEWSLDISGKAFPLAAFPHRQVKRGVSVRVNRGKPKIIKGAFVATMKSGHRSIWMREGKKRLPIDMLFSSRISDVFRDTGVIPAVQARGVEVMRTSFNRLLPLEIERLKKGK